MFWDKISVVYDLFERIYNRKCFDGLGERVAEELSSEDNVLECACGTGAISVWLAPCCKSLTVTDFSKGMLRQADKKLRRFDNVRVRRANVLDLKVPDGSYDKVIAGNVIHLLDDSYGAVNELLRVCKPGGKVIIPTYINMKKNGKGNLAIRFIEFLGADFKKQFDMKSYIEFYRQGGYKDVSFDLVTGRMPCAIAIINKH